MIRLNVILPAMLLIAVCAARAVAQPTTLPAEVRDVYIDPAGRAILENRTGDWKTTAAAVFSGQGSAIAGAKVLLIDHQHRIWLRPDDDREQLAVHMFDGKTWTTRSVSDIPANANRNLTGIHFLNTVVEDAQGSVWLIDGDNAQGWWIHRLKPTGEWETKAMHERALATVKPPRRIGEVLKFADPQVLIGPDGLFYAAWCSSRIDKGEGMGASGFGQFDGTRWSEYFYPTGSSSEDNVQSIIPLPDGSVGFVRTVEELRVVWMSSALNRPAPDLSSYVDRLTSLSSRERESAQAELIAMGPRMRKALEALADSTDDPEIKGRIPEILQEISKPPVKGVYGGKLTFSTWRLMHIARSGRVYLAVKNCTDKSAGKKMDEALVTISSTGVWSAMPSPTAEFKKPISMLEVCEDLKGRRWDRIAGEGLFLRDPDGQTAPSARHEDSLGRMIGCDADGRLYVRVKESIVAFEPGSPATKP